MKANRFKATRFAERHPIFFSFLLLLLFFFSGAAAVIAGRVTKLPPATFTVYSELLLVVVLVIIVSAMRWWRGIGYRAAASPRDLLIYAPALVLVVGNLVANLIIGVTVTSLPGLANILLLGLLSGFAEETVFRGLMLRAFLPRGAWTAVLASSAIFGFSHALNVLGGVSSPLYALVQIGYALAIGFCFAALALRGGLVWPLAICHALANFASFLSSGTPGGDQVTTLMIVLSVIYIVFFTTCGVLVMKKVQPNPSEGVYPLV